jgi:hypothetical protein
MTPAATGRRHRTATVPWRSRARPSGDPRCRRRCEGRPAAKNSSSLGHRRRLHSSEARPDHRDICISRSDAASDRPGGSNDRGGAGGRGVGAARRRGSRGQPGTAWPDRQDHQSLRLPPASTGTPTSATAPPARGNNLNGGLWQRRRQMRQGNRRRNRTLGAARQAPAELGVQRPGREGSLRRRDARRGC